MENEIEGWFGILSNHRFFLTIEINNRYILVDVVVDPDKYVVYHGGFGVVVTDVISARVEIATLLRDHQAITDDEVEYIKHAIEDKWIEPTDTLYLIQQYLLEEDL